MTANRFSLIFILLTAAPFAGATDLPPNPKFAPLFDCLSGLGISPYSTKDFGTKENTFVLPVSGLRDSVGATKSITPSSDNFLMFNKQGAQLFVPPPDKEYADHGIFNYHMTVIAPGETQVVQIGAATETKTGEVMPGFYGKPGWSEKSDANFEQYKSDPKPIDYDEALTLVRTLALKKSADRQAALDNGKLKKDLESELKSDYVSTGSGFGTKSLPSGQVNQSRVKYEKAAIGKQQQALNKCADVGDPTMESTASKVKSYLQAKSDLIDTVVASGSVKAQPSNQDGKGDKYPYPYKNPDAGTSTR